MQINLPKSEPDAVDREPENIRRANAARYTAAMAADLGIDPDRLAHWLDTAITEAA